MQGSSYTRVYGDPQGRTHFEDVEAEFTATGLGPLELAFLGSAAQLQLLRGNRELDHSVYHAAPGRQFLLVLRGEARVSVTDGECRNLGPGSVLLLDDIASEGHATEILGDDFLAAVVVL